MQGKLLGIKDIFLYNLSNEVIAVSGEAYPNLVEKKEYINKVIKIEEEKFAETIDQGLQILNAYIVEMKKAGNSTLNGASAFKLYDTYGFPIDLTEEILEEQSLKVELNEFKSEMAKQRERARNARGNMEGEAFGEDPLSSLEKPLNSKFDGFESLNIPSKVVCIIKDNEIVKYYFISVKKNPI